MSQAFLDLNKAVGCTSLLKHVKLIPPSETLFLKAEKEKEGGSVACGSVVGMVARWRGCDSTFSCLSLPAGAGGTALAALRARHTG